MSKGRTSVEPLGSELAFGYFTDGCRGKKTVAMERYICEKQQQSGGYGNVSVCNNKSAKDWMDMLCGVRKDGWLTGVKF